MIVCLWSNLRSWIVDSKNNLGHIKPLLVNPGKLGPIAGKPIQLFSKFRFSGHELNWFLRILAYDTDVILENSSKNENLVQNIKRILGLDTDWFLENSSSPLTKYG